MLKEREKKKQLSAKREKVDTEIEKINKQHKRF